LEGVFHPKIPLPFFAIKDILYFLQFLFFFIYYLPLRFTAHLFFRSTWQQTLARLLEP
jgi:hypothetical protein